MPTVRFTRNIQLHVECPPLEVAGTTVRDVLEEYFASNARARDYVLDERGRLRHHMAAFVAATLNHGHFGVKLHRSRDGGETWSEIAAPKYPDKPRPTTCRKRLPRERPSSGRSSSCGR